MTPIKPTCHPERISRFRGLYISLNWEVEVKPWLSFSIFKYFLRPLMAISLHRRFLGLPKSFQDDSRGQVSYFKLFFLPMLILCLCRKISGGCFKKLALPT
jgi:hypothetical protein